MPLSRLALFSAVAVSTASGLYGQATASANIVGIVTDSSGAAVAEPP